MFVCLFVVVLVVTGVFVVAVCCFACLLVGLCVFMLIVVCLSLIVCQYHLLVVVLFHALGTSMLCSCYCLIACQGH